LNLLQKWIHNERALEKGIDIMQPLTKDNTRGNWATLLLPINNDDSIDYCRLREEIDYLIEAGVDGIYSNGTAGEFHNQTEEEYYEINRILAVKCEKSGMNFQIGASHMSPVISLGRIRRAKELNPGAFQVILPDWFPVNDDEAIAFLKRIAEEAFPVGIVLYNPPHAKRVLTPEFLLQLCNEIPGLIGIKVADGEEDWYTAMKDVFEKISVFVPGHHLATGVKFGARGAYSNVTSLSPKGAQKWYELMKIDLEQALEIEVRLREFMSRYISPYINEKKYMNAALDKFLAVIGNWSDIGSRLRWPYGWIPEQEAEPLRKIAKEMLPEMFDLG
jgi:4-hydroxy-tetrahydrodipicolinate synthase